MSKTTKIGLGGLVGFILLAIVLFLAFPKGKAVPTLCPRNHPLRTADNGMFYVTNNGVVYKDFVIVNYCETCREAYFWTNRTIK